MTRLIRLTLLMLASGSSFENDHIRQFPGFNRPGSLVDAHSFSDSYSISSYAEADQVSDLKRLQKRNQRTVLSPAESRKPNSCPLMA